MIGKPYALVGQVRFDEGGQDFYLWTILNGHEAGNGGYSQGLSLKKVEPVLYSTSHPDPLIISSHLVTGQALGRREGFSPLRATSGQAVDLH